MELHHSLLHTVMFTRFISDSIGPMWKEKPSWPKRKEQNRKNWFNDGIKEKRKTNEKKKKNKVADFQRTNRNEEEIDAQSQITQVIYNLIRIRTCPNRK